MSLTDAVVGLVQAVSRHGRIERLLQQLGWSIDERNSKVIGLYFRSAAGRRTVCIANGDDIFVAFVVYSDTRFDSRSVPDVATNYALVQNDASVFGKWEVFPERGDVIFRLAYTAIGDGLTPVILKKICESMIATAGEFDALMREKGYL